MQSSGHASISPHPLSSPSPASFYSSSSSGGFNFITSSYLVMSLPLLLIFFDSPNKLLYSKLAPFAIPPVEFLWRNKFNFLKAGILAVLYFITTLLLAVITYYIVRSFFIVKEHSHDSLYFDFNAPLPTAAVKFNSDSLVQGQPYNAIVELELPESPPNIEIGMFMITLQIFSDSEKNSSLILESSRPCILRYKTELLRTVHTLSFSVPSLVGLYEQKQNLDVSLAENFMPDQTYDTVRAVVILSKPNIQVYSSALHLRANLSWLSYFVLRWPITSFLFGTTLSFAFHAPWLGIIFLLSYLRIASPAERAVRPVQPPPVPYPHEDAAAQRERMERELTLRARMEREAHLRAERERVEHDAAMSSPTQAVPRVRTDVWGILEEVEQEEEEDDEERREMEEELQRRLVERKREMQEDENKRNEGLPTGTGRTDAEEASRRSSGSEGSSSSGEWIDVNKDEEKKDDSEEDEDGESSSGLRRRKREL